MSISSEEKIKLDNIIDKICPFCSNEINIPVTLSNEIFCSDCGDTSKPFACYRCVREWLQLNVNPKERNSRKHLYCPKIIDTRSIIKSYTIRQDLINILDKHVPKLVKCDCGFEEIRHRVKDHMTNGSCSLSIWKCPGCNFRGNPSNYIIHTQKCIYIKKALEK